MVDRPEVGTDTTTSGGTGFADLPVDILESAMTNLSTIDLLAASRVSHKWRHAVHSSLLIRPCHFPWLIVRCLRLQHPPASTYSIHALDPCSCTWLSVTRRISSTRNESLLIMPNFLHGNPRDVLYALSISQLVISEDPFGASSSPTVSSKGPRIWRQDNPVAAEIDRWVVVVGGVYVTEFDEAEDEGAVEVYDKETGEWELAEPMPTKFEGSTNATWLSVAVSDKRLYVIQKKTGLISWFDPRCKIWGPVCQLRPDPALSNWAIGIAGKEEKLLLVGAGSGVLGEENRVMMVRTWEVEGDTLRVIKVKQHDMPTEMVDRLYPDYGSLSSHGQRTCSVGVRGTAHGGYIFDPANLKNGTVMYQLPVEDVDTDDQGRSGMGNWKWIPFPATVGCHWMEKISVGCSPVTLREAARCFT